MPARRLWSLTLAFVLGLTASASADTRLTIRTTQGEVEVMGTVHPAESSDATIWIGKERVRKDTGPLGLIVRLDQNLFHMLDHVHQIYYTVKLPFFLRDHLPREIAEAFERVEAIKPELKIVETGEVRKIGKWSARHCVGTLSTQSAMEQESHIWATKDLEIDPAVYARAMAVMGSLTPIKLPIEELERACGGFPVLRETTSEAFGASFTLREELTAAEVQEPPAGLYEPPAGYVKKEVDPVDLIQLTPYVPNTDPDPEP